MHGIWEKRRKKGNIWGKWEKGEKKYMDTYEVFFFVGPARFVRAFRIFYLIWDWKTYTPQWNK